MRSTVAKFLTRIRAHDVDGMARLEVKPHDKDWRTAYAGSGWLAGNYADALRGAVHVEVKDDTELEQQWHVCLRFGSPEQSLRLTVLESGSDGHFSPDGGHRKLLLSGFAEVRGTPKPDPSVKPGAFCAAGIVGPQWS
ncbi:hypothetical protein [Actinoallomurus rhizosphaericola]|uniref:hypothetical protein n=1 Tax=Actinoallomurus rhizosphaericola TaxID=2952536 RepID=UPI002092BBB6|nr:hypothetical protein [Actinoallomurus rhizosphaericola]MCO5998787.1 hypothetical protein [Actinoallomurus rhizosphaericola]